MKKILHSKSEGIAAEKISDKYKKIRKKNIDTVEEIKKTASKKSGQITAKKHLTSIKK